LRKLIQTAASIGPARKIRKPSNQGEMKRKK
jgi:hypothetical protein